MKDIAGSGFVRPEITVRIRLSIREAISEQKQFIATGYLVYNGFQSHARNLSEDGHLT